MSSIDDLIVKYRRESSLQEIHTLTQEEVAHYKEVGFPDNVTHYINNIDGTHEYEQSIDYDLSQEQLHELLMHKQLAQAKITNKYLKNIKGCVVYFTVLSVIGILFFLFTLISGLSLLN